MTKLTQVIVQAGLLACLLALSHGLLKWVAMQKAENYFKLLGAHWGILGLALAIYAGIFFYYIFMLKSTSLSIIYPLYTGLSLIFVMLLGVLVFHERLDLFQGLGSLFIVIGVALMGM
ncbi:MAG: EamA family transporter [Desulfobulbaceae bacterium]|nr:EamA family transporter [Desulfobulbaceae bacterium]